MLRKIVDIFCAITFFILICGFVFDRIHIKNGLDKTKYIDKQQCIGLPSSDVNDYWACKKEIKK